MFVDALKKEYEEWPYDDKVVPSFLTKLKAKYYSKYGENLSYARIQRLVCVQRKHMNGEPWVEHFIRFMQYVWSDMDFDPWRVDMIKNFVYCRQNKIKEYSIHGASGCRKTSTIAMTLVAQFFLEPKFTTIYITSPFKEASQTGLFSAVVEAFDEAKQKHPWLPGTHIASKYEIRLDPKRHPRSFIKVVTVDNLGKMIGKKPKDPGKGMIIVALDEAPEFKPSSVKNIMQLFVNMKSLKNFMAWSAGNFSQIDDLLGLLSEPDHPQGYLSLDPDKSIGWRTNRKGLCRRYDGEYSPNIILGYERYNGLNTQEYCDDVAADGGGKQSPEYYRFVRSFPITDLDEYKILNYNKIMKGDCYREPAWTTHPKEKFAFCDPGFGGDPCGIQMVESGKAWFVNAQGQSEVRDHIHIPRPMEHVKIKVPRSAGDKETDIIDNQVVAAVIEYAIKHNIPYKNIGYDGSMRSGIVHAFTSANSSFQPIDNLGKPTDRDHGKLNNGKWTKTKKASDLYTNYNTEQHFDIASLVASKQITGVDKIPEAVKQLCRRRWKLVGKKREIQPKTEYKEENRNKSPTEADTVVGAVQMAIKNGFKMIDSKVRKDVKDHPAMILLKKTKKKLMRSHFGGRERIKSGDRRALSRIA